jgi:hypothetical protein
MLVYVCLFFLICLHDTLHKHWNSFTLTLLWTQDSVAWKHRVCAVLFFREFQSGICQCPQRVAKDKPALPLNASSLEWSR